MTRFGGESGMSSVFLRLMDGAAALEEAAMMMFALANVISKKGLSLQILNQISCGIGLDANGRSLTLARVENKKVVFHS